MTITMTKPGLAAVSSPFNVPIGHTSFGPVLPVSGGRGATVDFITDDEDDDSDPFASAGDDDEDDDEDGDEYGDEEEPDERYQGNSRRQQLDEDWTPPDRTQWEKVETALKKANAEAGRRRVVGKRLEALGVKPGEDFDEWLRDRGIDPDTGERVDSNGHPADDETARRAVKTAESRGAVKAEAKYRPAVVRLAAKDALREAGWVGQNLDMALRFIDPQSLDVRWDDNGDPVVTGLGDQIAEIQGEFPDWFKPREQANGRRTRGGARQVDGGNRRRASAEPLGWEKQIEQRLMRR